MKYVSLKSTFWGFWGFWWIGLGDRVGSGLPYICGGRWSGALDYILRAGLTLAALWPLVGALRCLSC